MYVAFQVVPTELIKNGLFADLVAFPLECDVERLPGQKTLLQTVKIVEVVPEQCLITGELRV